MRDILLGGGILLTLGLIGARALADAPPPPPPGPGLDLINQRCIFCHNTVQIFSQHKTPEAWSATVEQMANRGAEVSPDEMKTIVDYLAKNYGASAQAPAAPAAAPAHN
jgi:hypothetical protein